MAIYNGDANDNVYVGGAANDSINGGAGNDILYGGGGADRLDGGAGNDALSGDNGNDTIRGGADDDDVAGGSGNDFLYGDTGNDTLDGGANNDFLEGGAGQDSLSGGLGDDTLAFKVGEGSDVLDGGDGLDTLTLDIASTQLTAAVRAELATLVAWMSDHASNPTLALANIGITVSNFEYLNVLLDGANVDVSSLLNAPPTADASVTVVTAEDTPVAGLISAIDPENGKLSWAIMTSPQLGTLTLDQATGAYIYEAPQNYSGNDSFVVRITDEAGLTTDQTVNVSILPVADAPQLQATAATVSLETSQTGSALDDDLAGGTGADVIVGGDGNDLITGDDASVVRVIPIDITASLVDLDGSETLTVRIAGLPADAILSAGVASADGSWILSAADLTGLKLSTAATANLRLSIEATATESDGSAATTTAALDVTFAPSTGNDTLYGDSGNDTISGNAGNDSIHGGDGDNLLDGGAGQDTFAHTVGGGTDTVDGGDGNDTLVISLASSELTLGVRSDLAVLNAFMKSDLALQDAPLTLSHLGLTISSIEAVSIHLDGIQVDLQSLINSAPLATAVVTAQADEDVAFSDQLNATDRDGDTLTWQMLDGPDHGFLVLDAASGSYSYIGSPNYSGADQFTVRVTDPLGAFADQTVEINVAAVADAPRLAASIGSGAMPLADAQASSGLAGTAADDTITGTAGGDAIAAGDGNDVIFADSDGVAGPLALNISAALADLDGSETLSLRVTGLPSGASLSKGAVDADGSWNLSVADLDGLTLAAAPGSTFTLTVIATATEDTGDARTATVVLPVTIAAAGDAGNDTVDAGSGNDRVYAGGGSDAVYGGDGDDTIFDGDGNDLVQAGRGNDVIYGGSGDDRVHGGRGDDVIFDAEGNDRIWGGNGHDLIVASTGANCYDGGSGFDTLDLSNLNGTLIIDLSKGKISGLSDSRVSNIESVIGNDQGNTFAGTGDCEVFTGGAGADIIRGGGGADILTGGAGRDVFSWTREDAKSGGAGEHGRSSSGPDTITDFGAGDTLDLHSLVAGSKLKSLGDAVHLADNAWGTMVSVKVDSKFVDLVKLEGFHESSLAHMAAADMIML